MDVKYFFLFKAACRMVEIQKKPCMLVLWSDSTKQNFYAL